MRHFDFRNLLIVVLAAAAVMTPVLIYRIRAHAADDRLDALQRERLALALSVAAIDRQLGEYEAGRPVWQWTPATDLELPSTDPTARLATDLTQRAKEFGLEMSAVSIRQEPAQNGYATAVLATNIRGPFASIERFLDAVTRNCHPMRTVVALDLAPARAAYVAHLEIRTFWAQ